MSCNGSGTPCISGAELRRVEIYRDGRGELGVLDLGAVASWQVKRLFYIRAASSETVRAEHAVSANQVILALSGGVTVDLDNGSQRATVSLSDAAAVLVVSAGVWLRLRGFQPDTVLLVASSLSYAETTYYDQPRPELLQTG